ncbi:MAG: hypothetical protein ACT4P1_13550 [Sporichthyaceae bacterium]
MDDARARHLPGDDLIARPELQFDRVTTFEAAPEQVWPWLVQLGKGRAGWYLPARLERRLPPKGRGLRRIEPDLQRLAVGDRIDDWGLGSPHFTVRDIDPPRALVLHMARRRLRRGRPDLIATWALVLDQSGPGDPTRLHARLRIEHVGIPGYRLLLPVADAADKAITEAMFRGLRERLDARR